MQRTRYPLMLVAALALILSACNPRQDTPPPAQNLITEAPLSNYDGGDETVYFLAQAPDGSTGQFEAGFVKNGKLTLNAGDPPVALQHRWLDTIPDGATHLEYSEGAEGAMAVHVTAILIGDTGLMVTGSTGLSTASTPVEAIQFVGLTWTDTRFDASFYPPQIDSLVNVPYSAGYTAYGLDGNGQYSNPDLQGFLFEAQQYLDTYSPDGGLPHPYFSRVDLTPDPDGDTPGDEEPGDDKPGDEEPGDEDPGDNEPGDDKPGDEEPGNEEPGDEEPELPVEVKAVINNPVNTVFVDEVIVLSAAGSTGEGTLTFEWNLGDGSDPISTTNPTVSVRYPNAGEFTFTLKVTDDANQSATATGTTTVTDPNIVTFQVQNYTGDEAPIGIPVLLPGGDVESVVMGAINSAGLITLDFSTPVPDEHLMDIDYIFPDGSYSQADVKILLAAEGIAFMAGNTPEPGEPFPTLITAVNRADYPSNPTFGMGDALGFYLYADQAVDILTTPGMSPGGNIDLALHAGWNFITMQSPATGVFLTNADPADYHWFEVIMEPEPEVTGISFEESEWSANPGDSRIPTVYVDFDNGSSTWFDPDVFGTLTWSSSEPSVATVNSAGEILAHSYGTAIITASYNEFDAHFTVNVNTVELYVPPTVLSAPLGVYALHPIGTTGPARYRVGTIDTSGRFSFNSTPPTLTPITNNTVIDASLADNQDVNLAFMGFLDTGDDSLWIGEPMNHDGTLIPGNSLGTLWYSDDHVNINGTAANGDTYDLSLIPGWNLIVLTGHETMGSTYTHHTTAPMNGPFNWQYEKPTALVIETTPTGPVIEVHPYLTYPSRSNTPISRSTLQIHTSNDQVAFPTAGVNNIFVRDNGTAVLTFTHSTTYLQATLTITDYVPQ